MGLRIWNQLSDLYNHDQLADNWSKLDLHDHTPGRGIRIPAEGIDNEAVIGSKISPAFMQAVTVSFAAVAANDGVSVSLTWPVSYADTSYHVYTSMIESATRCFSVVLTKTITGVTIGIRNPTATVSGSGTMQALGIKL